MYKGAGGFVQLNSPNNNIIFADVGEGDNFGQLELYFKCVLDCKQIAEILKDGQQNTHYFTV